MESIDLNGASQQGDFLQHLRGLGWKGLKDSVEDLQSGHSGRTEVNDEKGALKSQKIEPGRTKRG